MIGQNESHYRAYRIPSARVPGGGYQVQRIHIYERNLIVFRVNRGYFEDEGMNVIAIDIPEPAKARRVNLERTDCFFVSDPMSTAGRYVDLYIPAQIAPILMFSEKIMESPWGSSSRGFYRPVTIKINAIVRAYTGEKDARGDYVLQEKRISAIHERTAARWELTEEGIQAKVLHDQMKTLGIGIDFEDVIELLKYYDVKMKP